MADPQLVAYIREQLAHGADQNALRTVLANEGWSSQDVEEGLAQAHAVASAHTNAQHQVKFAAVAVVVIVVLILATSLFLVVFRQVKPNPGPTPIDPDLPLPDPAVIELTGWAACVEKDDFDLSKDNCYYQLNQGDSSYDCDAIPIENERDVCYRAKTAVLLAKYQESQKTV